MVHVTLFGGTAVPVSSRGRIVFTMFGSTELRCPSLGKRLAAMAATRTDSPAGARGLLRAKRRDEGQVVAITIFGATVVKYPTMAEEFVDLRDWAASCRLSPAQRRELLAAARQEHYTPHVATFTLFGGFDEEYPDRQEQQRRLEELHALGVISDQERRSLSNLLEFDPRNVQAMLVDLVSE